MGRHTVGVFLLVFFLWQSQHSNAKAYHQTNSPNVNDHETEVLHSTFRSLRRTSSPVSTSARAATQAPQNSNAAVNHKHSYMNWSFVCPIISFGIMAWAVRRHKLITCCGDDIPDEIIVPNDSGSVLDYSSKDNNDMEMRPMDRLRSFRKQRQAKQHQNDVPRPRNDSSSLKTRPSDEDDSTTGGNFVLMRE